MQPEAPQVVAIELLLLLSDATNRLSHAFLPVTYCAVLVSCCAVLCCPAMMSVSPAAPDVVAHKLLLLLSACSQLARIHIQVHIASSNKKTDDPPHQHFHFNQPGPQQQQQPGPGGPAAGPGGPGGAGQNDGDDDDDGQNDDQELLGFDPVDSEYCYGWIARLLQELQQQQQQQQRGVWQWQWALNNSSSSSSSSSGSMLAAAVVQKRQLLQPVLVWGPDGLQQQQQQQQQQEHQQQQQQQQHHRLWTESSAGQAPQQQQRQQEDGENKWVPHLVIYLSLDGAAFPSDPADWEQLQPLSSLAKLLLPTTKPCLLPCMVGSSSSGGGGSSGGGVVCLQQLRALQLSVEAGYTAPHMAHAWGLGVGVEGAGPPSCIQGLSSLTRLTHLALHSNGASVKEMTMALMPLTGLRELLLSGSSVVHLPAVATKLTRLQMLVLQQQVGGLSPSTLPPGGGGVSVLAQPRGCVGAQRQQVLMLQQQVVA
jgi:hypothetical protein